MTAGCDRRYVNWCNRFVVERCSKGSAFGLEPQSYVLRLFSTTSRPDAFACTEGGCRFAIVGVEARISRRHSCLHHTCECRLIRLPTIGVNPKCSSRMPTLFG